MTLQADHSDLGAVTEISKINAFRQNTSRFGVVQAFWASPERASTDATSDVLEITFTDSFRVNWMQFDLAKFPHTMTAEYWNDDSQSWLPLVEVGGSQVSRFVHQSVPGILPLPRAVPGHQNPQHSFLGHWQTEQIALVPTQVLRMRLVLVREPTPTAPVDIYGNYIDYSLAVRNFSIGYQVASADDIPRTLPSEIDNDNQSYSTSFASTDDMVGSTVEFSARTLDASRAILDNAEDAMWRSELQPDPSCVVSLYADVRDSAKRARVIDRIFIDPINTGAHLSLYFAHNAAPGSNFVSGASPLPNSRVDATQNVLVDSTGMHFSAASVYPASESVVLDNDDIEYNPANPWWVGLIATPSFNQTVTPTDPTTTYAVLFDCGPWLLAWTDTGLVLQFTNGDQVTLALAYQGGLATTIFASFDGTNYTLWASNAADTESNSVPASAELDSASVSAIALGSDLSRTFYGQSDISSLVIKEEQPPADGSGYQADPRAYTEVAEYALDEPDTSRLNAVLRFDPLSTLTSNNFPWALFAGHHSGYEKMLWTPVPRDYTAQRGWIKLPPVKAKYWKLEFTHLQATYADISVPVQQVVRHFPANVIADYRQRIAAASSPVNQTDDTHANIASYTNYVDTPSVVSTGGTGQGFTNTEVFVADDLAAADRLYNSQGENWNYQRFLSPLSAPRFNTSGVHTYQTEIVTRTSKVAYQVGLRGLKFARSVPSSTYDTPQYEDEFFDTTNLDSGLTSWVYDEDQVALTSGLSTGAQIVSQTMQSNRDVRGLQFAAQQSPPKQMLADANFDDPRHQRWTAVGDARIEDGIKSPAFDQLLPVVRSLPEGYWEDIAPLYGTWGAIEDAGVTWLDLQEGSGGAPNSADGNGIASEAVALPDGGYIYAAARVYVDRDLFAPLWLQIVDSVTGAVLNEEPATPRKGQIAEWFTTYELGTALANAGVTWGDLEGDQHYPSYLDDFQRPDATGLGRLDSGQPWDIGEEWNASDSIPLDVVSNAATVTNAGARSVIDVGTPWGSLTVELGNLITPGTPVELFDIGTLVVRTDGHLIDPNTGYSYATLTLAAGDTLRFDCMPTSQVPPAHASGADAGVLSWSVSVFRNGTFVTTISTAQPFSSVRGIAGAVGQTFASFGWTPTDVTVPVETMIYSLPMPRDGGLDGSGGTWVQNSDGRVWGVDGQFTDVDNGIVQSIAAPPGLSFDVDTDVDDLYGAMTFQVTLSTTTTDPTTYYVAKLDDGQASQLYLRADGALVQSTPDLGTVVLESSAVPSFTGPTTVLFVRTSDLTSTFKTTYSLSDSYSQTLVFINGTTVVGTYQRSGLFVNTTRGVMGTDGSVISGFTWGPNLGAISGGVGARTWDDVSGHGTRTWADVSRSTSKLRNPIIARVVQKVATQDIWFMDAMALYIDPIVWEFSNDNGSTWISASTIRNNPNAAVMFTTTGTRVSNQLRYRVTAYATDTWLSHLVIRPWYVGFMRDMPIMPESPEGPNLNPLDSYVPVHEDPNFMVWSQPIPREFFFAFRSILPGVVASRTRDPFISERSMV